jgi:tRNA-dihydrouridine synthase 4
VDAVDLNCGCPQKWAVAEGIGASLLKDEAADRTWSRLSSILSAGLEAASRHQALPVSVKIRIMSTAEETVELVRRVEALGAAWITVHGRTKNQRPSDKPDYDLIKLAKESVGIPVIANGDVFTLEDAERIQAHTGVNGVMAARGLLENPGLFSGLPRTTWPLLDSYVQRAVEYGTTTAVFHHHISQMTASGLLSRNQHRLLNGLTNTSIPAIMEYLEGCRPTDTAIAL